MNADAPLRVVLCWHMHQPEYRDLLSGEYQLPWTYLHAIKDYTDMAAHLEAVPGAKAVVNFAPVLLEQLDDLAGQIQGFIREGPPIRDPLLRALAAERFSAEKGARAALVAAALRSNQNRLIERFKPYERLCEVARSISSPEEAHYLSDHFIADLLTWYHLAWLGETVRRNDPRVRALIEKGRDFSLEDRLRLLALMGDLIAGLVPRYRALHERGQVELSLSPYAHPIVPLLLSLDCALEAMPDAPLPALTGYPEGDETARRHVTEGIRVFERYFGFVPEGCWPSEGGVSEATLRLFDELGFRWAASGEGVLRHSLEAFSEPFDPSTRHRPYRLADCNLHCLFRNDELSDDIGFNFADWHADDAVGQLVDRLESIVSECDTPGERMVAVILDGENAWEHFPENGYHFLSALYTRLARHPQLELSTFSECVAAALPTAELSGLVAGSWVYGSFSTWIGESAKNRAWEMLADAKRALGRASARLSPDARRRAEHQVMICEGSDWFWWLGDSNPNQSVNDFDRLFRLHLRNLYRMLDEAPPDYLDQPIAVGGGEAEAEPEAGGVMRRSAEHVQSGA